MECAEVQERLLERQAGTLTDAEEAAFAAHIAGCASCRRVADADERLSKALSALPKAEVRVPSWAQVKAAHAARRRRSVRLWLAPAMASAAALGAAAWMVFAGAPEAAQRADSNPVPDAAFGEAHMLLAVADQTADPNRVVAWMYEGQDAR